ncbi:biopolymer transporter ExbD [Teredinibacter turnerae]|uniref:ExbD/TolR family protein n=1 Tax=Teredinibacter turnerae TaxID=2426 RepID=UPI0003687B37|nr:biopolymer transporter ExbD [Teredinibacter turnerae]
MRQSVHAKRMAHNNKRHKGVPKLNLVSLMDIFTILVFFLLVNSSDVEVLQSNKDIKLPESIAEKKPEETLVVTVTIDALLVGGRKVADLAAIERDKASEITPLKEELEYLAKRKPYADKEAEEAGRDVTIMGDKTIPYNLLKKIMTTCAKADYRNISLAVSQVPDEAVADSPAVGG